MKTRFTAIFLALAVILATGCASIVSKNQYPINISSTPSDVDIVVTDRKGQEIFRGITPVTLNLKSSAGFFRKADYLVGFEKAGYDRSVVPIRFKLDGWYFGNIVFGGFIGLLIVDPATGAMYKLDTEFVNETMQQSVGASSQEQELKIYSVDEIPREWTEHLERIGK